jgi:predicted HTH transcriptional regulator
MHVLPEAVIDPNVGEPPPNVGENVGENDQNVGENTPDVGETPPNVGENVPNVGENVGENAQNVGEGTPYVGENADPKSLILTKLKESPELSAKELAALLGKTPRTVERHIKELREQGLLVRIGADKGGHWEVR